MVSKREGSQRSLEGPSVLTMLKYVPAALDSTHMRQTHVSITYKIFSLMQVQKYVTTIFSFLINIDTILFGKYFHLEYALVRQYSNCSCVH